MQARDPKAARAATALLVVLLLLVLTRLVGMAVLPLMDSTEARYAEIGRKMAQLGDWVTPWHNPGVPFWGKPPLSFWLTAVSFKTLGLGEFAARLPHLLCAAAIAWLTWKLGASRSRAAGTLAVALLAGAALFYVSAGAVMTDGALVLGTTLAMAGFWGRLHDHPRTQVGQRWWLFVGLAIGLLAKGPVALVLIAAPLMLWTLVQRQGAAVWRAFPWLAGAAWITALAVPWYLLAELRTPGFLEYFLIGEHWHRFVTPGWSGDLYGNAHRYPPGTIWVFAFAATLPWSVLLPAALLCRQKVSIGVVAPAQGERAWRLYVLLWTLTPLIFFTAARNIIWTYVLPALPALALWAASWMARWERPFALHVATAGLLFSTMAAITFGVSAFTTERVERKSAKAIIAAMRGQCPGQAPVFLEATSFSASYYSQGTAKRVRIGALPELVAQQSTCVGVRLDDLPAVEGNPEVQVQRLARIGGHELVRLRTGHAATSVETASSHAAAHSAP